MSSFTIEAFLYDLAYKHGQLDRVRSDPVNVFNEYGLSARERSDLQEWNVRAMADQGVSPMLLFLCWQITFGIARRDEYLSKMGATKKIAA